MAGKQPTHTVRAKTGRKDDDGNDIFFQVGVAWPFANGKGFSMKVNALPVGFDGNLLLTENKDE
jgi:hypothetical protein